MELVSATSWICTSNSNNILGSLLLVLLMIKDTLQGPHEERLIDDIFMRRRYNRLARPVAEESDALEVSFGLSLQQLVGVDEKNEMLHTNMWLNYRWNDYKLGWNETLYGGVRSIRLPSTLIWTPDILLYNSADEDIDSKFPTNIVVYANGDCSWVPLGLYISTCSIHIKWFPFDEQYCLMKFGSWTYDGSKINLTLRDDKIDLTTYNPSGEWDLVDVPAKRNVFTYECCPEPYIDITFTIHIRRRVLYYGFNLILPVALLSFLALLTFLLPPDTGEKISLGVPAKRSVNTYECCPEPYIDITFTIHIRRRALYYGFNLILPCSLISFLALLTFQLPPDAGEKISLGITILLSLSVFSLIVAEMVPPTSFAVPLVGVYFAAIMIMCTISVIMTVMVLNFHHRNPDMYEMPLWVKKLICEWLAWVLRMSRPGRDLSRQFLLRKARMRELESKSPPSLSLIANVKDVDNAIPLNDFPGLRSVRIEDGGYSNMKNELLAILNELRFITHKIKEDGEANEETNDWKFAAMVIDRLCFWIFSVYLVVTTCSILFSAQNIFVS